MTWITSPRGVFAGSVLLLSGCLLMSACGGAGTSASSASGPGISGHGAPSVPGSVKAEPGTASGLVMGQASRAGTAQQTAKLTLSSQSIIYTASLTLRSASAMATAKAAIAIVTAAGGYTAGEQAVAGSGGRSGGTVSLTVKVPVSSYPTVLTELSAPSLGRQISLTQQATDVTQEVANVNSLVTSQQDAITALQGLLQRAGNIGALLQVQQQISNDESSLESLQAQQRALDHETSYATISMTLLSTRHLVPARKHPGHHGFVAGLAAGWHALRHATGWLLTALGAALPFGIVLVILAGIGYLGRRRYARRGTGPTAVG